MTSPVRQVYADLSLSLENLLYIPMRQDLLELERWLDGIICQFEELEAIVEHLTTVCEQELGEYDNQTTIDLINSTDTFVSSMTAGIEEILRHRYAVLEAKHQDGIRKLLRSLPMSL